jgi:hypothetical protein
MKRFVIILILSFVMVISIAAFLGCVATYSVGAELKSLRSTTTDTPWILVLFLLPCLIQVFGLLLLNIKLFHSAQSDQTIEDREDGWALWWFSLFYLSTMFVCLFSYSVFWSLYVHGEKYHYWQTYTSGYLALSGAAMLIIAVLLALVLYMTYAIITGPMTTREVDNLEGRMFSFIWKFPYHLKRGAAKAPFLALLFFLTVFLGISYLFGFALAFHDKTTDPKNPALVMRNLSVPEPSSLPASSPSPLPTATFKFADATARLMLSENDVAAGQGYAEGIKTAQANKESVEKLCEQIRSQTRDDNPIRVVIVGYADLRQLRSSAYQSNYELAEARSQNIKREVLTELSAPPEKGAMASVASTSGPPDGINDLRNIEWVCLSDPERNLSDGTDAKPASKRGRRSNAAAVNPNGTAVDVYIQQNFESPTSMMVRQIRASHPKSLTLMDYIYFANYTITTTGYGDIIPNTAYTKFICSFANICEVFFLVVFFNSLLSLRGNRNEFEMPHRVGDLHEEYIINRKEELREWAKKRLATLSKRTESDDSKEEDSQSN